MYFKQRTVLGLLIANMLLFSGAIQANSKVEAFIIKPGLCVVEQGSKCKRVFTFHWRLSGHFRACLYQGDETGALKCEHKKEVTFTEKVNLEHSDFFTLKVENEKQQQDISVRYLTSELRQVRRHVWSVF